MEQLVWSIADQMESNSEALTAVELCCSLTAAAASSSDCTLRGATTTLPVAAAAMGTVGARSFTTAPIKFFGGRVFASVLFFSSSSSPSEWYSSRISTTPPSSPPSGSSPYLAASACARVRSPPRPKRNSPNSSFSLSALSCCCVRFISPCRCCTRRPTISQD